MKKEKQPTKVEYKTKNFREIGSYHQNKHTPLLIKGPGTQNSLRKFKRIKLKGPINWRKKNNRQNQLQDQKLSRMGS